MSFFNGENKNKTLAVAYLLQGQRIQLAQSFFALTSAVGGALNTIDSWLIPSKTAGWTKRSLLCMRNGNENGVTGSHVVRWDLWALLTQWIFKRDLRVLH